MHLIVADVLERGSKGIRADVVRKLDRGEPEPETLASGSAASSEARDASDPAPFRTGSKVTVAALKTKGLLGRLS